MNWKQIKIRVYTCWDILTVRKKHWLIMSIDRDGLVSLLTDKPTDIDIVYHGLQPYLCSKMIRMVSDDKDESDLLLEKALFEAQADEYINRKEKSN